MATFTVTTAQNIDALTGKAGGDTYNINGGTLTIDQDSRYGLNQNTSASLGNITVSATLGGTVEVDARSVRLIPYDTGSGNVPANGTTISEGGVSGKLIGVWSSITSAPTAAGAAMPASGYIKVKQVTGGAYSSGALTGISANATGADVAGWIEIVGDESATATIPRLGLFRARGEWFEVGTTSGSTATTYQLPTSGLTQNYPGVFVETGSGTGVFDFYPCMGSLVTANAVGTDSERGRVCWISTAGVLRLGSDGTNTVGYCPPSGRRIVFPNVIFVNCTTAARTANATPNATLGTRYDFTTTGAGTLVFDKVAMSWYPSFSKPATFTMAHVAISDRLDITQPGASFSVSRSGTGITAGAAARSPLVVTGVTAGGSFSDCAWAHVGSGGNHSVSITDSTGLTFSDDRPMVVSGFAPGQWSMLLTRVTNSTFTRQAIPHGSIQPTGCSDLTFTDTKCWGRLGSIGTQLDYAFRMSTQNYRCLCNGLTIVSGGYCPATALMYFSSFAYEDIELRNIGTYASPLSVAAGMGSIISISNGAYAKRTKVRRVYVDDLSSFALIGTGSDADGLEIDNCGAAYADSAWNNLSSQNSRIRGMKATNTTHTPAGLPYGTLFADFYVSTTTGYFWFLFSEPSAANSSLVTLTGTAAFDATGSMVLPTNGDSITMVMDYFCIGHTAFQNAAPTVSMVSGVATVYDLTYQIDKNDGAGWNGTWKAATGANLSGESGIDAALGWKLKIKLTANANNTAVTRGVKILTNSTTTTQAYQYPLGAVTMTFAGVKAGTEIRVYDASGNEKAGIESCAADQVLTWATDATEVLTYRLIHLSYGIKEFDYTTPVGVQTLPIQQSADRWWSNP